MKALIFENKVVDIQENEFDVAPTMNWVDCDNTVKIGFNYDGTNFTSNLPTDEEIAEVQLKNETKQNNKESALNKFKSSDWTPLTQEEIDSLFS